MRNRERNGALNHIRILIPRFQILLSPILTRFRNFFFLEFNWRQIGTFLTGKVQILLSQLLAFKSVHNGWQARGPHTQFPPPTNCPIILLCSTNFASACYCPTHPSIVQSSRVVGKFLVSQCPSHSTHHPLPVSHNFESSSADLYFLANGKRASYCDTTRRHVWNDIPYYTLPMSSPTTTCPFTPPKRAILSYICFCQSLNHNSATRNAESDRRTDMQT